MSSFSILAPLHTMSRATHVSVVDRVVVGVDDEPSAVSVAEHDKFFQRAQRDAPGSLVLHPASDARGHDDAAVILFGAGRAHW